MPDDWEIVEPVKPWWEWTDWRTLATHDFLQAQRAIRLLIEIRAMPDAKFDKDVVDHSIDQVLWPYRRKK